MLTVNELLEKLKELQSKGKGDCYVVVPTDDEGNDYRVLPDQDIISDEEEVIEYLGEWDEEDEEYDSDYSVCVPPNKVVIL